MAPAGRARHRGGRRGGRRALMRPRDRGPEPVPVEARAYFSPAQIERAEDVPQRTALDLPRPDGGRARRARADRAAPAASGSTDLRRPVLAGAAVAAAISVATGVAALPLSAVARERAKDVGLVTQDWLGYAGDVVKTQAIGAGFAALGGAVLVVRHAPLRAALVAAGRGRGRRLRRDHQLRRPGRARPAVQRLQARCRAASCGPTCCELAREAGRRRGRGLRDGRLAPHDRRQRLRDRPRRDQAGRPLRHAGRRTSSRPRRAWSSHTSSATCTTTTSATG